MTYELIWWTHNSERPDRVVPALVVLRSWGLTCLSKVENPLVGVHQGSLEIQGLLG